MSLGPSRGAVVHTLEDALISSPAYILNSDATDGDASTNLHRLQTSVKVKITRGVFDPVVNASYRVSYKLLNEAGDTILLNVGGVMKPSDVSQEFAVSLSGLLMAFNATVDVSPDPWGTLLPTGTYRVECELLRKTGGLWSAVAGATAVSNAEPVLHFTNTTSPDADYNVRAYPIKLVWNRAFMVTGGTPGTFQVSATTQVGRYDDYTKPRAQTQISFQWDFDLVDTATDEQIPLAGDGLVPGGLNLPSHDDSGARPLPALHTFATNHLLRPLVQLDPVNTTYELRCTLRYTESNGIRIPIQMDAASPRRLLHFNGTLLAGTNRVTFDRINNTPAPGTVGPLTVDTTLMVPAGNGRLIGNTTLSWGGPTTMSVKLKPNGDAILAGGSQPVVVTTNPAARHSTTVGDHRVSYGPITLDSGGLTISELSLSLPQGTVLMKNTGELLYRRSLPKFDFTGSLIPLTNSAMVDKDVTSSFSSADATVTSEDFPLLTKVSAITLYKTGLLRFTQTETKYLHKEVLEYLETTAASGGLDSAEMAVRPSNDGYFRYVDTIADPNLDVSVAKGGSARISAKYGVSAGSFDAHFPLHTHLQWTGTTGKLTFEKGEIAQSSYLDQPDTIHLPYNTACPDSSCLSPGAGLKTLVLAPEDTQMSFTRGGGLLAAGKFNPGAVLQWGARGNGTGSVAPPAHETGEFKTGVFHMPGHQIYAYGNFDSLPEAVRIIAPDVAPGLLLNADATHPASLEKPGPTHFFGSPELIEGSGNYAGLNLTPTSNRASVSRIGGEEFTYETTAAYSKYYVRLSGVSGRHIGEPGSWSPGIIYGYPFDFSKFQMTFLSSQMEKSGINGQVAVDGATTFTQSFAALRLSCTGDLESAEIDPDDLKPKPLVYWNGMFQPRIVRFAKGTPADPCGTPPAKLVIGSSLNLANIPEQLHGELGFNPDGNLTTIATAYDGVDSRLPLPSRIRYAGPNNKAYPISPVGKLYFNNPEMDPDYAPGKAGGFATFAAAMDVPYFADLAVQLITGATDTAPLYVCGGWTEAGGNHFNMAGFDPGHKGWPVDQLRLAEYVSPTPNTDPAFLPTAKQKLFGLIDLSYPLRWDPNANSFTSMKPNEEDILVATVQHQVSYMDAKYADITFGVEYDGLPRLNVTSFLTGQIDDLSSELSGVLTSGVKVAVESAVNGLERVLDDTLDAALDPFFDQVVTEALRPFYEALAQSYEIRRRMNFDIQAGLASGPYATWQSWINDDVVPLLNQYIYDAGTASGVLLDELARITDSAAEATSFVGEIDSAVLDLIRMIDILVNQVRYVEEGGRQVVEYLANPMSIPSGQVSQHGLIQKYVAGGSPQPSRQILAGLLRVLLKELTPPDVASVLGPLLSNATSSLNQELNALLAEAEPALDQITEALNHVRGVLVDVHEALQQGQALAQRFQNRAEAAIGEMRAISQDLREAALEIVGMIAMSAGTAPTAQLHAGLDMYVDPSEAGDEGEMTVEEFVARLKAKVRDRILGSQLVRQFKFEARQILYDIENRALSAVNSIFAQANLMMKSLIKDTIGELESRINAFLGKAGDYVGSGELQGFARINGDSLRQLRLDGNFQLKVPDEMQLRAYLEINVTTAEDDFEPSGCVSPGQKAVEVKIGATDIGIDWLADNMRADLVEIRVSMKDFVSDPFDFPVPNGAGGSLVISGGFDFEGFSISQIRATFGMSVDIDRPANSECYFGGGATMQLNSYEVTGALFFGRTCSLDPLRTIDPDSADVITSGPFCGVYAYGEAWIPISEVILGIPATCLFRISAGIGAGMFVSVDGPTYGGKMLAGVSGEVLCVISIRGEVKMIGANNAGQLRFAGTGRVSGSAGVCPICLEFSESVKITYQNGDWSVDL